MMDKMLNEGETVSFVFEEIKSRMCDKYCKYPEQYKVADSDSNWDDMVDEICKDCPLNIL